MHILVALNVQPVSDVRLVPVCRDLTEGTLVAPAQPLVFTAANYGVPQVVAVVGVDDDVDDGDVVYRVDFEEPGGAVLGGIDLTNADDDTAGVGIRLDGPAITSELGTPVVAFVVALDSQPTAAVTVAVESDDVGEVADGTAANGGLVVVSPTDWATPVTVVARGVRDGDNGDGPQQVEVTVSLRSGDAAYDGEAAAFEITNDNIVFPTVTDFEPNGPISVIGGMEVIMVGTDLVLPGLSVLFDGVAATNVTAVAGAVPGTRVALTTPSLGTEGYVNYRVVNPDGGWFDRSDEFYYTSHCPERGSFGVDGACVECPEGAECPGGDRLWPVRV